MIGSTISHYQILEKLGEGGMGVVYKAEDTRLGRQVALKFISPRVEDDAASLERFLREARLASSLNHPHICTIYDVGAQDGQYFIAIELLEGRTLRQLVAGRPLSTDQIIEFGIQIADGLDAAHRKGIVHRDIKPDNLFVTSRGSIKIMDFGLAKLSAAGRLEEQDTEIPTVPPLTPILTEPGLAVGTAAYMSPEQARGEGLDSRSDLFSFGVVLYFMATGIAPFRGNTTAVVFHALLENEPPPPMSINPALPERLQEMILKALEKDRENRYQSAREMVLDLRRILRGASSTSGAVAASQPVSIAAPRPRWRSEVGWAAAVFVAALAAAGYWMTRRPDPAPFERISLSALTDSGRASQPAISPDGRYVVYADEGSGRPALWLRQVAAASAVQILPPDDVEYGGLTVSPDGNSVYFVRYPPGTALPGNTYQIPILGGAPRLIVSNVISAPTFSPDGRRMAFIRKDPVEQESLLVIANVDGSGETVLASRSFRAGAFVVGFGGRGVAPSWSSDGTTIVAGIAATHAGLFENINAGLLAVTVADGQTRALTVKNRSIGRLAWLPGGKQLLVSGWDVDSRELRGQISLLDLDSGESRRVTQDLSSYTHGDLSIVARGDTFAAVEERTEHQLWIAPGGDFSRAAQLTSGSRSWRHGLGVLADGRILATDSEFNLAVLNRDGTSVHPFIVDSHPQWGPTGCGTGAAFIRLASLEDGELWYADKDGNRPRKLVSGRLGNPTCTPDGQWVFLNFPDETGPTLTKIATADGSRVKLLSRRSFPSAVSPDGDLVAVVLEELAPDPVRHLAVVAAAGGEPRIVARNVEFSYSPLRWTSDGQALAYVRTRHGVSNLWRQPIGGGSAAPITQFTTGEISDFSWAPSGDVVFARGPVSRNIVLIRDASRTGS